MELLLSVVIAWILVVSCAWSARGDDHDGEKFPPCDFQAIYNFGDSNSDTGGGSAAFYRYILPGGETFFHKAVGRASDGRLIIDFIAKHLGLPFLSAYLNSLGTNYRRGANFAIGSATIMPSNVSFSAGGPSPFSLEIQGVQFTQFKIRTADLYDKAKGRGGGSRIPRPEEFSKALYTFDIGQNDIAHGLQEMTRDQLWEAIPNVVDKLAATIQNIYDQGGRAFWIHNTGPLGCLAVAIQSVRNPPAGYVDKNGCVNEQNQMAMEFNRKLKDKIIVLRDLLPEAAITYVDVYSAKYKLIDTAKEEGFVKPEEICCGIYGNVTISCGNKMKVSNGTEVYAGACENPSSHISWDGVHYTDAANRWFAKKIVDGSLSDPPVPITHACYRNMISDRLD